MPKCIDGKKLTREEHQLWQKVFIETGKGYKATAEVKKHRENAKKTKG